MKLRWKLEHCTPEQADGDSRTGWEACSSADAGPGLGLLGLLGWVACTCIAAVAPPNTLPGSLRPCKGIRSGIRSSKTALSMMVQLLQVKIYLAQRHPSSSPQASDPDTSTRPLPPSASPLCRLPPARPFDVFFFFFFFFNLGRAVLISGPPPSHLTPSRGTDLVIHTHTTRRPLRSRTSTRHDNTAHCTSIRQSRPPSPHAQHTVSFICFRPARVLHPLAFPHRRADSSTHIGCVDLKRKESKARPKTPSSVSTLPPPHPFPAPSHFPPCSTHYQSLDFSFQLDSSHCNVPHFCLIFSPWCPIFVPPPVYSWSLASL